MSAIAPGTPMGDAFRSAVTGQKKKPTPTAPSYTDPTAMPPGPFSDRMRQRKGRAGWMFGSGLSQGVQ